MYICIVNTETKEIALAEKWDDPTILEINRQRLQGECDARGSPWELRGPSEKPFRFPTAEEEAQAEKDAKAAEIKAKLWNLDAASLRSLRAVSAGLATKEDKAKLGEIEAEAASLRSDLAALNA